MLVVSKIKRVSVAAIAAFGVFAASAPANAVVYTFSDIDGTNDGAMEGAVIENQFTVDVTDAGGGFVDFKFSNAGPIASAIEQINFDDSIAGNLGAIASIINFAGVNFIENNPNLPEGNLVGFVESFGVAATPPPGGPNGNSINPNEMLTVRFSLNSTFAAVIADLQSGNLRIGMHVISLANGGSDSFINNPPSDVPVPAALPLLLSGLAGLSFASRRKKKA